MLSGSYLEVPPHSFAPWVWLVPGTRTCTLGNLGIFCTVGLQDLGFSVETSW